MKDSPHNGWDFFGEVTYLTGLVGIFEEESHHSKAIQLEFNYEEPLR